MATILETGLIEYIMPVLVFLLIFAVVFAILKRFAIFGDNIGVNSVIAFVVALIFMITPTAREMVTTMTPWFIILVILVLFILMILVFIGLKAESLEVLAQKPAMYIIIIIIVALIFFVSLAKVFSGALDLSYFEFLAHPRILGVIFILVIASLAVKFIATVAPK